MRLLKSITNNEVKRTNHSFESEFDLLNETIPYIKLYAGQNIVIKFDEHLLDDHDRMTSFAKDIVLLKNAGINIIIVHGADNNILRFFEKNNIKSEYNDNTISINNENIETVEMVTSLVNKKIVQYINNAEGMGIGISGKDAKLIEAQKIKLGTRKINNIEIFTNNLKGDPIAINPDILSSFEESDFIPVIASIGFNDTCHTLYLESNKVAAMIATSISASKLILMYQDDIFVDNDGNLIEEISAIHARSHINKSQDKEISSIIKAAIYAVEHYTEYSHILNSNIKHGLVFEILSNNRPGTVIFPYNM